MLSFLNEINITIIEIMFLDNLFSHIYFILHKYLFTQTYIVLLNGNRKKAWWSLPSGRKCTKFLFNLKVIIIRIESNI